MAQLSGASVDRRRITNVRRWQKDLERILPEDVQRLARKYLQLNKSLSVIVVPDAVKQPLAAPAP